jgi:hypothetical protein
MNSTDSGLDQVVCPCENCNGPSGSIKGDEFLDD